MFGMFSALLSGASLQPEGVVVIATQSLDERQHALNGKLGTNKIGEIGKENRITKSPKRLSVVIPILYKFVIKTAFEVRCLIQLRIKFN